MIVTIGGNVGAGKTTLAPRIAKALRYEELYIGGVMRQFAAERGMTIEAFYAALKDDPELEKSIDARQAKLMQERDNLVIQGRVAWFFAKQSPYRSFNIFLGVSPEVGAARTKERPENAGRDLPELAAANAIRTQNELERYRALYGIENFLDPQHYDFSLDTTNLTENDVLEKILKAIPAL